MCSPTSLGTKTATLTVNADTGSDATTLTCTGVAPDIDLLTSSTVMFGDVTVGTASASANVTAANTGTLSLTVSAVSFSGMSGQFVLAAGPPPPVSVAPGASRTWQVRCQPTSSGLKTATFSITSDDPDESPLEVSLSCTGVDPQADLSIQKSDGGAPATAGQPITYTIAVSNGGPASVPDAQVSDVFPASVTGVSWTCLSAGGASCSGSGSADIADSVSLPVGGSATYTATGTVDVAASGSIVNTATVAVPSGFTDPDLTDNSSQVSTAVAQPDLIFADGFDPPPTTVVDIQMGLVTGSVRLENVVITALSANGRHLWVADAAAASSYGGIYVFRGAAAPMLGAEFAIGATIDLTGTATESDVSPPGDTLTEIDAPGLTLVSPPGGPPSPLTGTAAATLSSLVDGEPYEGVLVQLTNLEVTAVSAGDRVTLVDTNGATILMDDDAHNYVNPVLGTCFSSVTGVMTLDPFANVRLLLPRMLSDLNPGGTCN
jgi:uncharacterized repeat protein (TIGR01451 family)